MKRLYHPFEKRRGEGGLVVATEQGRRREISGEGQTNFIREGSN